MSVSHTASCGIDIIHRYTVSITFQAGGGDRREHRGMKMREREAETHMLDYSGDVHATIIIKL